MRHLALLSLVALVAACGAPTPAVTSTPGERSAVSPAIADIIDDYRQEIPRLMREQDIPGLSVAVVDDERVVWTEGFGVADTPGSAPVTPETLFSIQSTSKVFTATAVLTAIEDGLVDLDEPITTYLPGFTVHSAFEDRPASKITLRHLLSHTAGFTHEAPVGNNWDADADSFEAHIRSISDTWLRFPVGTGYAYSNLGIDLAGYVLQEVADQPFAEYVREHVFAPLGMADSTFDVDTFRASDSRATGHAPYVQQVSDAVPMVPAGGMYASAEDLARYVGFQLNGGVVAGRSVLDPELLDEMRTVQFPVRDARYGYGLGVARTGWYAGGNADLLSHGGGGFGFLSDMWWLPELGLGIVVLTNSSEHDLQGDLALSILDGLVHADGPYHDRLTQLPVKTPVDEAWGGWLPPDSFAADLRTLEIPADRDRWRPYLGEFKTRNWGLINPMDPGSRVYVENGRLHFDASDTGDGMFVLTEVEPGLFFTGTGEALDFRTDPATFRNLELIRVGPGPAPLAWAVLALCGLVMATFLLGMPIRGLWRLRRRSTTDTRPPGAGLVVAASGVGAVAGLFGLASIGLLVVYPRIIYSGYLGWLNLPAWQRVAMHAPFGLLVSTAAVAALAAWSWRSDRHRLAHIGLITAALVVVSFLAAWGLIGVG